MRAHGLLTRAAYGLGAVGLLGATGADALAVLGRHTGLHLIGSIELVQGAVVLLGCAAMLIATMIRGHASVHIVTDRLSAVAQRRLARLAALAGAVLFAVLAIGTAWIVGELWAGYEETELLHIPLRWLRVLWFGFTVLIAAHFLYQALAPKTAEQGA
jgi:TRAP-type C4-dicarboxylate transport system permease small subunit